MNIYIAFDANRRVREWTRPSVITTKVNADEDKECGGNIGMLHSRCRIACFRRGSASNISTRDTFSR
jgi:hypothetical protein